MKLRINEAENVTSMKLKDYPMLNYCLVKNSNSSTFYAPDEISDKWLELPIVDKYVDNKLNKRVLVIDVPQHNASSSFVDINNPDRIAANWIGPTKVGNVSINDYMRFEKGEDAKIVYMTPDEYLNSCTDIFGKSYEQSAGFIEKNNKATINKYAQDMLNGDKFPLPYLNYATGNQEGRHRAFAVKQAFGENSIMPVLVITPTDPTEEEIRDYAKKRWPKDVEWGIDYVKSKYDKFNDDIDEFEIEPDPDLKTDINDDFDIDLELDELLDDIDEEDFLNFVNTTYNKHYKEYTDIPFDIFNKAVDKYYDIR